MNLDQEKDLVNRAKHSAEAFGELYDHYFNQIFGYTLRRSADIETAKDVTSGVFYKALRNIDKFDWRGISFSHWLFRIANRELINHFNAKKHETSYESVREVSEPMSPQTLNALESELKKYDDYLDLHGYISKLPVKYQEVIVFRYFEDMSVSEIAMILQKPEGTVKSLIHRGINRLRKMMEFQHEYEE